MKNLNIPKTINAWCLYDWANSVYSLTITTAIFPIYFIAVTASGASIIEGDIHYIELFGYNFKNSAVLSFSLTFAFLTIALINPLLSGIADYSGRKKTFLTLFSTLGAISCLILYWFDKTNIGIGVSFYILATIGYAGSLVFYNAYLPEIATPDQFDRISARGFSMGYIGSVLLLILNLLMIEKFELFGYPDPNTLTDNEISQIKGEMSRLSFLTVGVWWLFFGWLSISQLPKSKQFLPFSFDWLTKGYKEVIGVSKKIIKTPIIKTYLIGFFFYMMSFQTIMYLATVFGSDELKIETSGLIATVLLIQLVAIGGAYLFSFSSRKIGNVYTLAWAIVLSIIVCIMAYFVQTANQFYILGILVGLIMGGIQSLSRSTFAKLIPEGEDDHASYFSFYELIDKVGTALGTAIFGIVDHITGSMRNSIFLLIFLFLIGLFFLMSVRKYKKI